MIYIYNILSFVLLPVYCLLLILRIITKKEDVYRICERFAITTKPRQQGKLIWIHAASVGEGQIALTLIDAITTSITPEVNYLVTSGTKSSANILAQKLPNNAVHQYLPIDNIIFIKKFLATWQPNLAIFIEGELWPCLISEASKKCKLLLCNARISERSFKKWQRARAFFCVITSYFSKIITQSKVDLEKFKTLGASNVINLGNIKFSNKKLYLDKKESQRIARLLNSKKIIVLGSTHQEDEEIALEAIKPIKAEYPNSYFIFILRHPERRYAIAKNCTKLGLNFSLRSQNYTPRAKDDLYIVDNFGEIGLFYNLSYITIVGGSFAQGGHNPIEPAHFNNLIMFGPDMSKCREIANQMIQSRAAIQFKNSKELIKLLKYFLNESNIEEAITYQRNSMKFVKQYQDILQSYLKIIAEYTP
jgi:3-deoxy-D-manno-octulosonic-acid transferase